MNKLGWLLVVIVLAGGVYLYKHHGSAPSTTQTAAETGPIKIGFIGPLTGDAANLGQNAQAGVQIAVDEVNKSGGINGRNLEVVYEDGSCLGAKATSAASKLINTDKVSLILGGACSGETMAIAGVAEQAKVPVLSYCSSAPTVTNAGDYIFRDYPSDNFQGSFAADYVYNKLAKKKVAVIFVQTDYGTGVKDVFVNKFKELGGTITDEEGIKQSAKDLRSEIAKIKNSKPDLVYFAAYTDESVAGLKQLSELGVKVPLFGADAWDDSKLWSQVGKAGEGAMYPVPANKPSETFKASMKAKIGNDEITACTPPAYDAVKIIAQVFTKVGTDSTAVKNELYNTTYTGGVSTDPISFDQNGDLKGAEYTVKTVHDGVAK